jgi:hypothetical protein
MIRSNFPHAALSAFAVSAAPENGTKTLTLAHSAARATRFVIPGRVTAPRSVTRGRKSRSRH